MKVKVVRKAAEAEGIASFELAREDGGALPGFSAGSHIDVHLPNGAIRQYSLCNDANESHRYRIAVLRDVGSRGGSVSMHDDVREGDVIEISEPRNHFPLVHALRTVLLAGGIGVTPLLCMAQRLSAIGADFTLHYSTRSRARTAFLTEIEQSAFADRVRFHFDDESPSQGLDVPSALGPPAAGTHAYICGPAGYIDYVLKIAQGMGWPQEQLHLEYFSAAPQDTSADRAFDIKIASSGKTIRVAAGQTVVQALVAEGVDVLTSCEQGVCGTCITRVLEGECDHRDMYFTDEEKAANDQFTPCCSRAKSALLVLDL